MKNDNFNIRFLLDQTPNQVFESITNVKAWWSEEILGNSKKLHDEFIFRHGDAHFSKQKIIEVIENKRMVWLITESYLGFIDKTNEWNGTTVLFEISKQKEKTKLDVTHIGLVRECECYEACAKGWTHYLKDSLLPLIITGQGNPAK